ncbi:hypothetical protein C0993_011038 [Termitomyces sp. T159_Od127]|nr:hypothetical protein C0993_011038 [Termitomyces sp. T159_Od127]
MGKWTPDYIDDVLLSKIKNLVSGAIKRVALEKTEPTITYDDFVHDLETGDSFTTSLIEILVKELAERHTRPNDDCRTITDRSARSLQQLAEHNPSYRAYSLGRHFPRRRSATLTDYLTAPPLDMDMEEDGDIFDRMLDTGVSIEGARINSDLYDAYGGGQSTRRVSSPSPPAEDATSPVPQRISQSHFRSGPWSMLSSSGSSTLTRQPSLRRTNRPRADFDEFTRRRRSSTRENQNTRGETSESTSRWESWDPFPHAQPARRFFPVFRPRRLEPLDSWIPDPPPLHDADDSPYVAEPLTVPYFNLTPPVARDQEAPTEVETSDERAQAAPTPRLRRAGVHALESDLSRHGSPIPTIPGPHVVEDAAPSGVEPTPDDTQASAAEPTSYPTPSSTEHEFFA